MHILIAALHRPVEPTGVCRHAANIARCLIDNDKITKVTIVIGVWQLDYFGRAFALDSPKVELVSVNIKNSSVARNIWFLWGLPKLASKLHPNLIHLSFPIPFFRFLFACPVVATIHDFYPYEYPENFGYPDVWFNRWFLKQCLKNSDGFSCVSKITLNNLYRYFPQLSSNKLATVIYNYVDFSQTTSSAFQSKNIKMLDRFILCVGQHRQNKNLDLLIKAYYQLKQKKIINSKTKLIIVGANGPETYNIKKLINNFNLQEFVLLVSSINDLSLKWLYQKCDLFVIASSTEGFCLPLAEAIYFDCKVVCSDIPIFREIGSTNCTYFQLEQKSVHNLVQAVANTLNQPCSSNPLDNYRFTKEKIAIQYFKLYSKVI